MAILALCAAAALAEDPLPKVVFTKSFPGSVPAWYSITVDQSGAAEYREDPKDENPVRFHMGEADTAQIFSLADKLDHFKRKLEAGLKVARMGDKTLHWEKGADSSETTFNFTEDLDGRTITDWFERISETERHLIDLERVVKYDKLGVNEALLQLEITLDRKRLIAPEQFLPMLDRVVKNESFMHLARQRAAEIASQIRNPK
ncbi:MAG TPA: hypothetical protein VGL72_09410 [Bryobacteraceae bacterium]